MSTYNKRRAPAEEQYAPSNRKSRANLLCLFIACMLLMAIGGVLVVTQLPQLPKLEVMPIIILAGLVLSPITGYLALALRERHKPGALALGILTPLLIMAPVVIYVIISGTQAGASLGDIFSASFYYLIALLLLNISTVALPIFVGVGPRAKHPIWLILMIVQFVFVAALVFGVIFSINSILPSTELLLVVAVIDLLLTIVVFNLMLFYGMWLSLPARPFRCARYPKSKWVAVLLSVPFFSLSMFGFHRYYLRYKGKGTYFLVSSLLGIVAVSFLIGMPFGYDAAKIINPICVVACLNMIVVFFWTLVDFLRILMDDLGPADGTEYREDLPRPVVNVNGASPLDAHQQLVELYQEGALTENEFLEKREKMVHLI